TGVELAVLSACETGLGAAAAGEGLMSLQRAFQVAGARSLAGSLWKVNDNATAALMAKFYHELWVNKRDPLAALREARLTIYRRPGPSTGGPARRRRPSASAPSTRICGRKWNGASAPCRRSTLCGCRATPARP